MKYLLVLILITGCAKPKETAQTNIYTYGDSITFGLSHPSWPEAVASQWGKNLIQNSHGGTSLFDKNAGGEETQYAMVMNAKPWEATATILWAPGENDAILHQADAAYLAQYRQGLLECLTKIHLAKVKAYIGTPNHNSDEPRFGLNSVVDQYAQINRDLIAQLNDPNIVLIDFTPNFQPTFDQSLEYYARMNTTTGTTLDGIHPNVYGYSLMTQFFFGKVK